MQRVAKITAYAASDGNIYRSREDAIAAAETPAANLILAALREAGLSLRQTDAALVALMKRREQLVVLLDIDIDDSDDDSDDSDDSDD